MAHILLADDEPDIRFIYGRWLESVGHTTVAAPDGASALVILEGADFDLVVLDVMMPMMDGFAVLHEIRSKGLTVPVVLVSATTAPADIARGMAAGATGYVEKVSSKLELLDVIDEILATHSDNNLV